MSLIKEFRRDARTLRVCQFAMLAHAAGVGLFVFVATAASNLAAAQGRELKGIESLDVRAAVAATDKRKRSMVAGGRCKFTIVANGATRRQVLARLFADTDVKIEWHHKVFADEKVYGQFSGTQAQIARRLLERRSYIICYVGDTPRVCGSIFSARTAPQKPEGRPLVRICN